MPVNAAVAATSSVDPAGTAEAGGAVTLAIDVGGTHTRLAIVRDGTVVSKVTSLTSELAANTGSIVPGLARAARRLADGRPADEPQAIGVGLAAAVDDEGRVIQPREFGIPAGGAVRDSLREAFQVPVVVENDANLAAWAEWRIGAARGAATVAVITLGTNIGTGLILDGRIHRGVHGAAGEVGLFPVAATDGAQVAGGRSAADAGNTRRAPAAPPARYKPLEEVVGGRALAAAAKGHLSSAPNGRVLTMAAAADPFLRHLADRAVEGWAVLIAQIDLLLDLELVVLTGGVAEDAAHLLPRLRDRVADLIPFVPRITLGGLGPDAELLGADLLARSALEERVSKSARAGLSAHLTGGAI